MVSQVKVVNIIKMVIFSFSGYPFIFIFFQVPGESGGLGLPNIVIDETRSQPGSR